MASRKIFRHLLHTNFPMFILLISNHTIKLVQFGVNLYFFDFRQRGSCNFSFFKNSLVQINSKSNSKPYDFLCK